MRSEDGGPLPAVLLALLDEALDLAPVERARMLARVQAEHPDLVDELEALLESERELDADRFLMDGMWSGSDPSAATTASVLAGRSVGPYSLDRPLGQGGMGSVWLAHRIDGRYEGQVAVKLLNAALIDPIGSERFRREGDALARLTHPNIAGLLDAGAIDAGDGSGQPFLVLEYVDGVRIDRYCDEHRLGPRERILLFQQVLAAVAHAHASLIVHRDIKPSNILVTADGRVKLLDFGIAKLLEPDEAVPELSELTVPGGLPFTPEYAAPEQVTGGHITTATDVYSLGVLLYLLLAGRHPTTPGGAMAAERLRAVVDTEPARLSAAVSSASPHEAATAAAVRDSTADRLRRLYLGDLDNIVARALRKDPIERYQTASALADDLGRFLRMEPVSARQDSRAYRAGKFVRRNRVLVTVAVMATFAMLGLTSFSIVQLREARLQRDAARYQGRRAEAQIEFQELLMSQVGERPLTIREIVDRGREVVERQYSGDPRFLGPMLLQLSRRYRDLGDTEQRYRLLLRADSLASSTGSVAVRAEVRCDMADQLRTQGEYDSAWATLEQADSLRRLAADPIVNESCLLVKAHLAVEVGNTAEAGVAARDAIASVEHGGRAGDLVYIEALSVLAMALDVEERYREAIEVHRRALAALNGGGRGRTMTHNVMQHNLALTLLDIGETREAEAMLQEVLRASIASDASGYVHPQPLIHFAEAALTQGRADTAAVYFARLVSQAARDSSRYWEGRGAFGLARAQARLGALEDARATAASFRRLRNGFPRLTSADDQLPDTLALDGWLALAAGDTARADALFMESLVENGFYEGRKVKLQRAVALQAAETALVLGRPDSALSLARQAHTIARRDSLAESRSTYVGESLLIEGRALLTLGDTTGALDSLERALAALSIGAGPSHRRTLEARSVLHRLPGRSAPMVKSGTG